MSSHKSRENLTFIKEGFLSIIKYLTMIFMLIRNYLLKTRGYTITERYIELCFISDASFPLPLERR